jgi:hypothetical protein
VRCLVDRCTLVAAIGSLPFGQRVRCGLVDFAGPFPLPYGPNYLLNVG